MHRNSLMWSYQLFLPKPWLRTEDFFFIDKEKNPCQYNPFMIEDSFSDKILIKDKAFKYVFTILSKSHLHC